jgi:hypothetical protein
MKAVTAFDYYCVSYTITVSLSLLQTILLLNTAICLVTSYGAIYWSREALGGALLLQSVCK